MHGERMAFLEAGADSGGQVVVLLHGLASSAVTWMPVVERLGPHVHVIAPDLIGHGRSTKPGGGDYSLGSYASGLRDLLVSLGVDRATIVGHSFGGGVAQQFAYQHPELTERLVLESSGGLGHEVSVALRAATLPGSALALRSLVSMTPAWLGHLARRAARNLRIVPRSDLEELAVAIRSFTDPGMRRAFVQTARSAVNWSGQRLDGTYRLYLLAALPVLFIAGTADPVIPVEHTVAAHAQLPDSCLEMFEGSGHFPHTDDPGRFVDLVTDFLRSTTGVRPDLDTLRRQLRDAAHS